MRIQFFKNQHQTESYIYFWQHCPPAKLKIALASENTEI